MKNTLLFVLVLTALVMGSSCTANEGKAAEAEISRPEDGWVEPAATDQAETTGAATDTLAVMLADSLPK